MPPPPDEDEDDDNDGLLFLLACLGVSSSVDVCTEDKVNVNNYW